MNAGRLTEMAQVREQEHMARQVMRAAARAERWTRARRALRGHAATLVQRLTGTPAAYRPEAQPPPPAILVPGCRREAR